jgi:transcriptional regulator with XRE-family HTH domain
VGFPRTANLMAADPSSFGLRLRRLRERQGLSQADLSALSGVSKSLVEKIEQGLTADPKLTTLRALARALEVSLDELAGGEG